MSEGKHHTHQEGAALQADHDVGELWDRGGAEAHVRHILLHLTGEKKDAVIQPYN